MTDVTEVGRATVIRWGVNRPRGAILVGILAAVASVALAVVCVRAMLRADWYTASFAAFGALFFAWLSVVTIRDEGGTVVTLDPELRTLTFDQVRVMGNVARVLNFEQISAVELSCDDSGTEGDPAWNATVVTTSGERILLIYWTPRKRQAEAIVTAINRLLIAAKSPSDAPIEATTVP